MPAGSWLAQRQALHDAANWLTVLLGHIEALSDVESTGSTDDPSRRQWHLELARRAARAAHRLCALPPGTSRAVGELEARSHCERLLAHVRPTALAAGVRLELDAGPATRVLADGPGFDDALLNLLRNAIESSAEGDLVTLRMVEVGAGWVRIEVQDTGPGFPQELRARLGEVGASTRPGLDRGLGLARVRDWLASHGTTLELGATPGGGARAAFRLPVARAAEPQPAGRGLKILLIEDDIAVAEVLGLLLAADGHRLTHRADRAAALDGIGPGTFDLVFCDQNLPDGRGDEVLSRIAAVDPAASCFLVTGDPQSVEWDPDLIRGVLAKPVTRADLREAVAQTIECRAGTDQTSSRTARPDNGS